jgi:uncharacterized protein
MLKKLRRTLTSVLPVENGRHGSCAGCGECCKLPVPCPFLKTIDGVSRCSVYNVRPLNCRKYPRSANEHITQDTCGYKFHRNKINGKKL